jgi:polyphosphate kinase
MTRNLESRVEVVVPIEDPLQRNEMRRVLDLQLKPNRCQWQMQSDGSYVRANSNESCQQMLIDLTEKAQRQRRRRHRGFARRSAPDNAPG